MTTMNAPLPILMTKRIEEQVKTTGPYSNASEHLHELVERDQKYTDKRENLIKALIKGENSGISNHTVDTIWEKIKSQHKN